MELNNVKKHIMDNKIKDIDILGFIDGDVNGRLLDAEIDLMIDVEVGDPPSFLDFTRYSVPIRFSKVPSVIDPIKVVVLLT